MVPAPGVGGFIQVEGGLVPEARRLDFTASLSAISRPLVLRNAYTGEVVAVPVKDRVTLDLGAELSLIGNRLSVGIGWPIALYQDGDRLRLTGVGPQAAPSFAGSTGDALSTADIGDIRLRGKVQLTRAALPVRAALAMELTVPGGGQDSFVASASPTFLTRLIVSGRWRRLSGGLNLGARFGQAEPIYLDSLTHHGEWGVALAVDLIRRRVRASAIGEAVGLVRVSGPAPSYPIEARGALRLALGHTEIDAGAGAGLPDLPLTPAWRAFVLVRVRVVPGGG